VSAKTTVSLYAVTQQGHHEEKLIRNILRRRSKWQIMSRPVSEEQETIDVEITASLHQIVKVVCNS